MKLIFKLAWRNIWRNRRRSILTISAIAFATLAAISMRGLQIGTYAINIKNAVNMFSSFIQIQKDGFQKNPALRKCFKETTEIEGAIKSVPEIKNYSPRIYADGLISFKDNSLGAAIFGIDPIKEKVTTKILDRINEGKFFETDDSFEIVLGQKLMKNLNAKIGDEVVVLSQGYDGSLGNFKFKIVGTIKMGMQNFDSQSAFIGIKTAQELVALYNKIHAVAIRIENLDEINAVRDDLKLKLNNSELAVLSWEEILPDLKQSIEFDNVSGQLTLLILIIIVAFGILNTVLMSVQERFNEFGVVLSIGMPQIKLVYLVIFETILLTIIGVIIGDFLGWIVNYSLIQNPIELGPKFAELYKEYGFLPILESSISPTIFINTTINIIVVSIFSIIYPVIKVMKLEPLKGIRYT